MRWAEPVLPVRDLRRSLEFYERVLGLEVVRDFGSHAALTGGLALQSLESWAELLDKTPEDLWPGGFGGEVYYEAENFDDFLTELSRHPETELVHPVREHRWGQRVARLYDPDRHIIEVGESMAQVARRFFDSGLNTEGVARRMEIPLEMVRTLLKQE